MHLQPKGDKVDMFEYLGLLSTLFLVANFILPYEEDKDPKG
jgi:hypothetical protein